MGDWPKELEGGRVAQEFYLRAQAAPDAITHKVCVYMRNLKTCNHCPRQRVDEYGDIVSDGCRMIAEELIAVVLAAGL